MRPGAGIAALTIGFVFTACSSSSAPLAKVDPTPLPSGVTLVCTNTYESSQSIGPLENGLYAHFLCQNGKVTSWWFDGKSGTEDTAPH